jgi:hypothetical protein
MTTKPEKPTGLALLREPFPAHQISKLPKPTKAQTDAVKADYKTGIRCEICGAWHHPKVDHLDYVGHAALTDRLLDADPSWDWEPLAMSPTGLPVMDGNSGMWIKLTVCGVTRLGYGHPDGKTGGNAVKEVIGDALRNAAMRFGAALDLWHKGDLHGDDDGPATEDPKRSEPPPEPRKPVVTNEQIADRLILRFSEAPTVDALTAISGPDAPAGQAWDRLAKDDLRQSNRVKDAYDARRAELTKDDTP